METITYTQKIYNGMTEPISLEINGKKYFYKQDKLFDKLKDKIGNRINIVSIYNKSIKRYTAEIEEVTLDGKLFLRNLSERVKESKQDILIREDFSNANVVLVGAHLDDIEIGIASFLNNIKNITKTISVYICSEGHQKHNNSINESRLEAFQKNMKKLNITILNDFKSTDFTPSLQTHYCFDTLFFKEKQTIRTSLENVINQLPFEQGEKNILCTLMPDIHEDHRIVSELCDVIVRPDRSIFSTYYKFFIPTNKTYLKFNIGNYPQQYKNKITYKLSKSDTKIKTKVLLKYLDNILSLQEVEKIVKIKKEYIYKIF